MARTSVRKVFVLALLDIFLVFAMISSAETSIIGVQAGSWAKYDISFEYTWASETMTEPSALKEAQKRDWNNVTVKEIKDSEVTVEVVTHVKNGTKFKDTYVVDIVTGQGNLTFPLMVAANLTEGEPIVSHPDSPVINKTKSMNYAGAFREVNFVPIFAGNVIYNQTLGRFAIEGNGSIRYFHFDKVTGFLCQFELMTKESNSSYVLLTYMNILMQQTNLWEPQPFSGLEWLIIPTVIITVPTVLFYFSRKQKKKRRRAPQRLTKQR